MRKVYKLTVYRKPQGGTFWGGSTTKETVGEYESKAAAEAAFERLKADDPEVSGKTIAIDWR